MNRIFQILWPRCEASTRMLVSSFGTSGLLHVLAGAALAGWLGSMAPHLFPPQQGLNSIQLTASQAIDVEAVDAEPDAAPAVTFEAITSVSEPEPPPTNLHRELTIGAEPALTMSMTAEATAPVPTIRPGAMPRTRSEPTTDAFHQPPVIPRASPVEMPLPTVTHVASLASRQDAGQLDAIPTQIYSPQPTYPAAALKERIEGRVVLRVKIDAHGRVASTSLLRSSGHAILDEAARQAVLQWRFEPPRRLGVAVQAEIAVPVRFRIEAE